MSATGGQLVFTYNAFLQRDLNGLDIKDPVAFKQNLGISSTGTTYPALTFGSGLNVGTYNASQAATISVNSSSIGTSSTIASYDSTGGLATKGALGTGFDNGAGTSELNFYGGGTSVLANISRQGGGGELRIANTRNSGGGGIVLDCDGAVQVSGDLSVGVSAQVVENLSVGRTATLSYLNVINGAVFHTGESETGTGVLTDSLTVTGGGGGTGTTNITGGMFVDNISGVQSIMFDVDATLALAGPNSEVFVNKLRGSCISDSTTGTSSTTAASSKALGIVSSTYLPKTGGTITGAVSITGGLTADTLQGTCISDSTVGTYSTVAASSKALGLVAASKLPLTGGTLTGTLFNAVQPSFSAKGTSGTAGTTLALTSLYPIRGFVYSSSGIVAQVAGRYFINISPVYSGVGQTYTFQVINYSGSASILFTITTSQAWSGILDLQVGVFLIIINNATLNGSIYFSGYLIG